ncbi:MAG TPA: hypothetical protein PLI95_18615, partial [Polyangiaceae bacterium]|nr:hypothetical protein [Polyangiaceae bacterium]
MISASESSPSSDFEEDLAGLIGVDVLEGFGGALAQGDALGAIGELVGAALQELHEVVGALVVGVLLLERSGEGVVDGVEIGGLLEAHDAGVGIAGAEQVLGLAVAQDGLVLGVGGEVGELADGARGVLPALRLCEAAFGGFPGLVSGSLVRGLRERLSGARRVVRLLAQITQLEQKRLACFGRLDPRQVVRDGERSQVQPVALLEELDRRQDRALVALHETRHAVPRFARCHGVLALLLLHGGELLEQRDLRLRIGCLVDLLIEQVRQIVPTLALLEQATQVVARAGLDLRELLERVDGTLEIPQLLLADARDRGEVLLALVLADARGTRGRLVDVAQVAELALRSEVLVDPREGFGRHRIEREHLHVLLEGFLVLALAGVKGGRLEETCDTLGAWRLRVHRLGRGSERLGVRGGRRLLGGDRQIGDLRSRSGCRRGSSGFRSRGLPRSGRGLLARRRQVIADLGSHRAPGVRFEIALPSRRKLALTSDAAAVVRCELDRAIVARHQVERGSRVHEPVLAVVDLCERDEQ